MGTVKVGEKIMEGIIEGSLLEDVGHDRVAEGTLQVGNQEVAAN